MSNFDSLSEFKGGLIQHGRYNDRIYLMRQPETVSKAFIESLIDYAKGKKYSKIFAKSRLEDCSKYLDKGFISEAVIPGFYNGRDPVFFMGLFLEESRRDDEKTEKYKDILNICDCKKSAKKNSLDKNLRIVRCSDNDTVQMAELYRKVFPSYPFPITDEKYLTRTMHENVDYFGIKKGDKIIALSSAEKSMVYSNAEMTDFATDPDYKGNSFAQILLYEMEKDMKKQGIKTLYTIARAASAGMNITFSRMGYSYNGRLINNTQICGSLESMNIWSKNI